MTDAAMGPIRICFVALRAYPLFNSRSEGVFGGAEVDLYLLATELAKDKNFQISLVVGDYGQDPIEKTENLTLIKSLDVNRNLFLGGWKIWRAMRNADAQIYMTKGYSLGTVLYALFCKRYNRKFIYRTASSRECNGQYIKEHPYRSKAFAWTIHSAKKILAQNHTDAENLMAITNVRPEVIRNGHRLNPVAQTARETILWVGRSASVKRPDLFLKLARQLPEMAFTMICQKATGDKRYDGFAEQAEQIENLHFISKVPFSEIDSYFQKAKVFVNTSDSEGFPNTFIQACKCATPILSLNVNPDGFLDDYNCGIGCSGDWEKFVDSINFMLEEQRYIKLGKNARKYVEKNHDITKIIERYKSYFIQMAQG
ncbi:MAG: glycosyltransferase family 4 protein [Planctomycetota bacterium]|jgi:glycosyltransferase involved in cell wall biosynthesis